MESPGLPGAWPSTCHQHSIPPQLGENTPGRTDFSPCPGLVSGPSVMTRSLDTLSVPSLWEERRPSFRDSLSPLSFALCILQSLDYLKAAFPLHIPSTLPSPDSPQEPTLQAFPGGSIQKAGRREETGLDGFWFWHPGVGQQLLNCWTGEGMLQSAALVTLPSIHPSSQPAGSSCQHSSEQSRVTNDLYAIKPNGQFSSSILLTLTISQLVTLSSLTHLTFGT